MRMFNHCKVRKERYVKHGLVVCELEEWGELLVGVEGFLEKFEGGFKQDIDEQDKDKKRGGEVDKEWRICCGFNNGRDEER
ncbi:hypothetical protein Tco_0211976 [Tanacetum coccineum]